MVTGIRIYVEGGGNARATRSRFREGFHGFLEKMAHASDLLARISALKAQDRAPHCKRLFETIRAKLAS